MNISLSNILFVLIIFQLLFLSLFLFSQKRGKRISNILLGFFFLSISLNLLDVFFLMTGVYFPHPYLAGWGSCLPLLFGPFIYLYTQSVLRVVFVFTARSLKHFLPFIILFLTTEFYFLIQPLNVQERVLSDMLQHHLPGPATIVSTLIFIHFMSYTIASLRRVSLYKKAARQYFSSEKQIEVSWLYSTIIFFLILIIITIVNGLIARTSLATYYLFGFNIIILILLVFIITVLFKALQKPYFFSFFEKVDSLTEPYLPSNRKISESEKTEKEAIAQTVVNYMRTKKPFLEPELTLDQLASLLSLKPRILSQAINEILRLNFYNFINRYRIEEASRMLTNPKNKKITILEILYEAGFNSKSSFNTLFKRYTGLTPTEFRKKQPG
jgi:AraC-like DNA-binding protein